MDSEPELSIEARSHFGNRAMLHSENHGLFSRRISTYALIFAFLAVILSGVSVVPTAALVALSISLVALYIIVGLRISVAASLILVFLLYCFGSALVFSGIDSISSVGFPQWVANEGRVFVAYWPALLVLVYGSFVREDSDRLVIGFLKLVTLLYFITATVSKLPLGLGGYSHHAGGAVGAALFIIWYFLYQSDRGVTYIFMLVLSAIGLVASDSRTGILGVVIVIVLMSMSLKKIKQLVLGSIVFVGMLFVMSAWFPNVYDRLAGALTVTTFNAVGDQFDRLLDGYTFEETRNAWGVVSYLPDQGEVNLVVRAYLWARGISEGMASPIHGVGFGRFNDTGREFDGVRGVSYAVYYAESASGSVFTAHNTIIQIFAELGSIGVVLLAAIVLKFYRAYCCCTDASDLKWARIGKAMCLALFVMGLFQHSFGAPIFVFTMFTMAAWCYCRVTAASPHRSLTHAPDVTVNTL